MIVFDNDGTAVGTLFVDDGETSELDNVTFTFDAYYDSATYVRIECIKSFDSDFDYGRKFRNLNLTQISILNHFTMEAPAFVFVNSVVHIVKQKLRFSKHFIMDVDINLLLNNCLYPIEIEW